MKFSSPGLIGSALFLLACASAPANAQLLNASAKITSPPTSAVYYDTPLMQIIPLTSSQQYVQISGLPGLMVGEVEWSMEIYTINNANHIPVIWDTDASSAWVLLDSTGEWYHKADGTGSLSTDITLAPATYTAGANASIVCAGVQQFNTADAHVFYVVALT